MLWNLFWFVIVWYSLQKIVLYWCSILCFDILYHFEIWCQSNSLTWRTQSNTMSSKYTVCFFIEHIQYQGNVLLVNTVTCVYMCECVVGVFSNKYVWCLLAIDVLVEQVANAPYHFCCHFLNEYIVYLVVFIQM